MTHPTTANIFPTEGKTVLEPITSLSSIREAKTPQGDVHQPLAALSPRDDKDDRCQVARLSAN